MARAKTTTSKAKTSSATTKRARSTATKKVDVVKVKTNKDVVATLHRLLSYNLHDRYNFGYSKNTKAKIVAYGPWLAGLSVVVLSPQLMSLAKNGNLLTPSGFFNDIFFNQQAWVILVVILINLLLLVDGLSDLFDKRLRGWNRVYAPALITGAYVVWQLFEHLSQPAAPILSLLGAWLVLFTLLDIKPFYRR